MNQVGTKKKKMKNQWVENWFSHFTLIKGDSKAGGIFVFKGENL